MAVVWLINAADTPKNTPSTLVSAPIDASNVSSFLTASLLSAASLLDSGAEMSLKCPTELQSAWKGVSGTVLGVREPDQGCVIFQGGFFSPNTLPTFLFSVASNVSENFHFSLAIEPTLGSLPFFFPTQLRLITSRDPHSTSYKHMRDVGRIIPRWSSWAM